MFEATLDKAQLLKMIVESIKDIVTDANIEVKETGLSLQAMDSSHSVTLGLNLGNFSKILKCAGNEDSVTLKAMHDSDELTIAFESPSQDRISEFQLKLMDIDSEQLGIPDQEYATSIKISSKEFQRIVRDMSVLGDTCSICCTKEGIKFSVSGDLGNGNITLRKNSSVDKDEDAVDITLDEPVELSFALRYLNFFTKATPLASRVNIAMSPEIPVVVAYNVGEDEGMGSLAFYLAPKIEDDA